MAMSAVGSKRCAVSSSTSRRHAAISDSPGSRWPAGWLSTSLPSTRSSTNRKRPSRSTTAATVADGFQMSTAFTFGAGGFLRVFPNEFCHPADTGLDRLPGGRIGEPHVLAFAWDARAEVDVGEQRHARLVQQALPELLGILCAHQAAGLGDVRPDVERAAGILALYARHLVQQPDDEVAALLEALFHGLGGILRPIDRLERRPLADLGGAGVRVGDPAGEDGRERRVRREPDAPAGHRPGLRGAVGNDRALVHSWDLRDREELSRIREARVDLVGVHPDLRMLFQNGRDLLELLAGEQAAGRVVGVVEDEEPRPRRDEPLELGWIEGKAARLVQMDRDRPGTVRQDLRLVDWKAGIRVEHLVARAVVGG